MFHITSLISIGKNSDMFHSIPQKRYGDCMAGFVICSFKQAFLIVRLTVRH